MLDVGRQKVADRNLNDKVVLISGDAENLNFSKNSFDLISIGFGVRNFQNLEKGIGEIFRVLKKNGTLVVLEFSKPKLPLIKQLYSLYMNVVTPGMGGLFSKNRNAYQYLNDSVQKFPEGKAFQSVLDKAGFQKTNIKTLSFGICTIYTGEK